RCGMRRAKSLGLNAFSRPFLKNNLGSADNISEGKAHALTANGFHHSHEITGYASPRDNHTNNKISYVFVPYGSGHFLNQWFVIL
ncbi:hypothetical protein, partial [Rhodoligotrophos appendicifer]